MPQGHFQKTDVESSSVVCRGLALKTYFILYVASQERSTEFYKKVLASEPVLFEPGMTEFALSDSCLLGIMPAVDIKRILGSLLPEPSIKHPSSEIYMMVDDPLEYHKRALNAGAVELSPLRERGWGDIAAYSLDLDGNVLVFAKRITS